MSPTTPKTPPDTKSVHSMEPIGNIVPENRTEAAIAACKYELAVEAILLDIEIDEAIRAIDEEIEKGKEILLTDPSSETAKALARSVIRKIIELEHRPLT